VFLPLSFLVVRKIIIGGKPKWNYVGSLIVSGLILSHQAVSISFIPFIGLYALLEYFNLKKET